jgi:hypothetical protein
VLGEQLLDHPNDGMEKAVTTGIATAFAFKLDSKTLSLQLFSRLLPLLMSASFVGSEPREAGTE